MTKRTRSEETLIFCEFCNTDISRNNWAQHNSAKKHRLAVRTASCRTEVHHDSEQMTVNEDSTSSDEMVDESESQPIDQANEPSVDTLEHEYMETIHTTENKLLQKWMVKHLGHSLSGNNNRRSVKGTTIPSGGCHNQPNVLSRSKWCHDVNDK